MKFETERSSKIQECSWSVSNPSIKAKPRWHGRSEVEAIQFQGKTEDQETEEARSEAVTHTFSILDFQDFSFYLTAARSCFQGSVWRHVERPAFSTCRAPKVLPKHQKPPLRTGAR